MTKVQKLVMAKHRTFNGKRYVWQNVHKYRPDADKEKASLQKRGWLVRIVKGPAARYHPNQCTVYIRKK